MKRISNKTRILVDSEHLYAVAYRAARIATVRKTGCTVKAEFVGYAVASETALYTALGPRTREAVGKAVRTYVGMNLL